MLLEVQQQSGQQGQPVEGQPAVQALELVPREVQQVLRTRLVLLGLREQESH